MARRKLGDAPKTRFRSNSGHAIVRIDGQVIYLGPWDSQEARDKFHRLMVEWHARYGRPGEVVDTPAGPAAAEASPPPPAGLTIAELCLLWIAACEKKYTRKDGRTTSSIHGCHQVVRALELDSSIPAGSFKARVLVSLQERLVAEGKPRVSVNRIVKGVRRIFRWAVVMEHVPATIFTALEAVDSPRQGQTDAPELPPVTEVDDENVEAALKMMPRFPRHLVRFIRLVGCRPGEACKIRPMDVDTASSVWRWDVPEHKTT